MLRGLTSVSLNVLVKKQNTIMEKYQLTHCWLLGDFQSVFETSHSIITLLRRESTSVQISVHYLNLLS